MIRFAAFWQRITDGVAVQQLWSQLRSEARASYRLYSKDIDWTRGQQETRGQRQRRIVAGLFWAMVLKLSPARRVLFVVALVCLVLPGIDIRWPHGQVQIPNLSFASAILFFILLTLELADRVTMKRDLEIAKEIQTWLMPVRPPEVPGFDIAFATRPANTVAGDYYDAFPFLAAANAGSPSLPLLLVVADVAGKSVPAALLMATLQASLRTLAAICQTPLQLIERLNLYSCERNTGGQRFTTAFLAELDPSAGLLTYVNAGHNWPVLRRASGAIERLETGGLPLGVMRDARYECGQTKLASGDLLLVFTDGVIEAENDKEEQYGEQRMLAALDRYARGTAAQIVQGVMASADTFAGTAPQHDDVTCLVLRCPA